MSAASCARSAAASSSRRSAATRSPCATSTRSPGTTCSAGISTHAPSRRTRAGSATSSASAAIARPGAVLLREPDQRVEDHDGQHDEPVLDLAERERQAAGREQRPHQRRAHLIEQQARGRRAGRLGQPVGPEARQARLARPRCVSPSGPASSAATTSLLGRRVPGRRLRVHARDATNAAGPCHPPAAPTRSPWKPAAESAEAPDGGRDAAAVASPARTSGLRRQHVATIVVGIEDSLRAQDAVALAGDLARASGAEVLAVCAYPFDAAAVRALTTPACAPRSREAAEETLEALCEPLSDLPVVHRVAVADPSPARALLADAAASGAALIVVGSSHAVHGRASGQHRLAAAAGAPCPIALAPQGHRLRPHLASRRVTAAFDGSAGARAAVFAAAALARVAGAAAARRDASSTRTSRRRRGCHAPPGFLRITQDAERAARSQLERAVGDAAGRRARVPDRRSGARTGARVRGLRPAGRRLAQLRTGPGASCSAASPGRLIETAACPVLIVPNGVDGAARRALPSLRRTTDQPGGLTRIALAAASHTLTCP